MQKQRSWRVILLGIIYLGVSIAGFALNVQKQDMQAVGMGVVALLTPWILPLLMRLCRLKMTEEMWIIDLLFTFFASLIGSCFGGYGVPFFDKVLHFISGILVTNVAVMLFQWIVHAAEWQDARTWRIFLLFITFANLATAVLWEFYEYFMLVVFNNDAIHHYDRGVHDTMTDMLCAFCAGLIVTALFVREWKSGKKNIFSRLTQHFYEVNHEERADDAPKKE